MLNFDTSFIFQKSIAILNKEGIPEKKSPEALRTASIQFFPEGGNLVNTLETVVAFKANDDMGMPVKAKGNIVSSKGTVITSFSTLHDGMGTFTLTPEANETYKAVWTDASGNQQTTPLPEAKAEGLVIKMTPAGNKKVFTLSRTDGVPAEWRKVTIVALLGQERVYKAIANLESNKMTSGSIPVGEFPSGILQVTVFSQTWEPLVERIVMINNDNYHFNAAVNTPELNTNFRAKNTVEIAVDDTILTNMSLSVTDAIVGRQTSGDNIISRILLTGDIKGYVHNPTYYFSNNSDSVAGHLDLVMLTHGWRRYNWSNLARGRKPVFKYLPDSYLSLKREFLVLQRPHLYATTNNYLFLFREKTPRCRCWKCQRWGLTNFQSVIFPSMTLPPFTTSLQKTKRPRRKWRLLSLITFIKE